MTEPAASGRAASGGGTPSFAHASEAELARILDFYEVRWAYEPDTFPIGWNLDGDVVESFSPDFYLPDLDLYVELTTLKQKLVRKKNRKLRRLRELYPDVHIKLFYARDFRMLLLKFGRLALSDELTGTTGQATPPRVAPDAVGRRSDDRRDPRRARRGCRVAELAVSWRPGAPRPPEAAPGRRGIACRPGGTVTAVAAGGADAAADGRPGEPVDRRARRPPTRDHRSPPRLTRRHRRATHDPHH